MKTLFETIQAAGIEHSNHESDLYLPITPEVNAILKNFPNVRPTRFKNQITGTMWYDVPFAFQPWWEKRAASVMGRAKSDKKAAAAKENGKRGGRPKQGYTAEQVRTLPWGKIRGTVVPGSCGRRLKWVSVQSVTDETPDRVLLIDCKGEREVVSGARADQRVHQGW